ncbi:hypothetical protein KJ605_00070 [Patescibacteria group bacterium]|nr:hypothetical protein [Patescibacteria group bacterium]MBU1970167.1 hypothetical protein [Patescibacteria group bacterium]
MSWFRQFIKRNRPVFFLGLVVLLIFVAIILLNPDKNTNMPAGFKKVEETVFDDREPTTPPSTTGPTEYAPQIPSPENKGKPYFYGEHNPNLRDEQGYPTPPQVGTTSFPSGLSEETLLHYRIIEEDNYANRTRTVYIDFTNEGFMPADSTAFTGQRIIWTNKTGNEIIIKQTVPIHEALKNGITLQPNESFEFRPLLDKKFTYVEKNSLKYGSIFVSDVTLPLMRLE